jgi:hypothetical protein
MSLQFVDSQKKSFLHLKKKCENRLLNYETFTYYKVTQSHVIINKLNVIQKMVIFKVK